MIEQNKEIITLLTNEILDLIRSDLFLSGNSKSDTSKFICGGKPISWVTTPIASYIDAIDINNEDTPYLNLKDYFLFEIGAALVFFTSYTEPWIKDHLQEFSEEIQSIIFNCNKIDLLANQVSSVAEQNSITDDYKEHIVNTILNNLICIAECRALLSSRFYLPIEVLFDAYKNGLFPYGWDWDTESFLCIKPDS